MIELKPKLFQKNYLTFGSFYVKNKLNRQDYVIRKDFLPTGQKICIFGPHRQFNTIY